MFFAPDSGEETRRVLSERLNNVGDEAVRDELRTKKEQITDQVKIRVQPGCSNLVLGGRGKGESGNQLDRISVFSHCSVNH